MSEDWQTVHREALVIDSHNDSIVSHIRRGNLSLTGREKPHLQERGGTVAFLRGPLEREAYAWSEQLDFAKMRAGGIDAAFFAVDVTRAWKNHLAYALDALGYFDAEIAEDPDEVLVVRNAGDLLRAAGEYKLAALLVIENSDALEASLNILWVFHRLGVRSITLTHNPSSWAAAGNAESRCGGGLTEFGVRLIQEMNRLRMLVDVSHISPRGFCDTLEISAQPVIASHSCCAALCDHPRNLSDEQLRALAQNRGVVGITFVESFLQADWSYGQPESTFPRLIEHIDHAVEVAGIDHVGIGSDFDGGGTALKDATEFPRITQALLDRGYPAEAVRKILGGNHLRLLRETIGE
jgi:membrane dipeptidase